jgi:nitrogen fixation-related uncharacterized protein
MGLVVACTSRRGPRAFAGDRVKFRRASDRAAVIAWAGRGWILQALRELSMLVLILSVAAALLIAFAGLTVRLWAVWSQWWEDRRLLRHQYYFSSPPEITDEMREDIIPFEPIPFEPQRPWSPCTKECVHDDSKLPGVGL